MKEKLDNLTIVMTCRVDSKERFENIVASIGFYQKYTNCNLIVLEADNKQHLSFLTDEYPNIKYVFVYDTNPIFHRTRYINMELKLVKTSNAACIDVDTIVPINQLRLANETLNQNSCAMVIPYDGRAVAEDDFRSDLFRESLNIEVFKTQVGYGNLIFGFISVGGAYLCNVEKYREFGWENENFIGWGPEDYERFIRLDILGQKPLRIPGVIYHLNHPRGINSRDSVNNVILATKREYCKICSMMPKDLIAYIDSWAWNK